MLRSIVNEKYDFIIEKIKDQISINGERCDFDFRKIDDYTFHIIFQNKTYTVFLTNQDKDQKKLEFSINGRFYSVTTENQGDILLKKAGIVRPAEKKADQLLAPMPGLILDILVSEQQHVKSGEALVILKAMKMENILKSPHDGIIKKILAEKNQKIEKDSVLIQF